MKLEIGNNPQHNENFKEVQTHLKPKRYLLRCFDNPKHLPIKTSHVLVNTSDSMVE